MFSGKVLVLGGYGGVGKSLCFNILKYTNCSLYIGARNLLKADEQAKTLRDGFPSAAIEPCFADAKDYNSLVNAFKNVDIVIVTATVPNHMNVVAKAAIKCKVHLVDTLVRGDVAELLERNKAKFQENRRFCITQSGFHPGLIAPMIRFLKDRFDVYNEASVGLAMDPAFNNPKSTYEIIHEIVQGKPRIFKNGSWEKATYKDALSFNFDVFGEKTCFPLVMKEIYGLEKELSLKTLGVYAAGFNYFIDKFVFALAIILGKLSSTFSERLCGWLMFQSSKKRTENYARAEMKLIAKGRIGKQIKTIIMSIYSNNSFDLTSLSVLGCIKQAMKRPNFHGIHLMANVVDEDILFNDLKNLGIRISVRHKKEEAIL